MIARFRGASRGLAFRIAVLLAVTLLPIGIIALAQTLQLIEESNRRAETSLLALTSKAAGGEEGLIRAAFGSIQAIVAFVPLIRDDPAACEEVMQRYLKASDAYSFAGYVNADGIVTCASAGVGMDFSDSTIYKRMKEQPAPYATVNRDAPISEVSVIIMGLPVVKGSVFDGYVVVSLPHPRLQRAFEDLKDDRPLDLITFNKNGEVLTSQGGMENVDQRLPEGRSLESFVGQPQSAFTGKTESGDKRVFAVVPVVSNLVYAIGSWKQERLAFAPGVWNLAMPIMFPALMWLACLGVAFLAVERMVIRPTRNLRARMLLFMRSRQISPPKGGAAVPIELREIDETWERLAISVLKEEAKLEDMIQDKNVLLKEVHHRVKNNLQLIVSILNMTIRTTRAEGTRAVLADLQSRLTSLAAVHQILYETSAKGRVRADEMLQTIVRQIVNAGLPPGSDVDVRLELHEALLYPDQAVPLTLATTEAVTNALKYTGKPADGPAWISVRLSKDSDVTYLLEVANTMGEQRVNGDPPSGGGLGRQLINAFANQLNGEVEVETKGGVYRMKITFPVPEFVQEEPLQPPSVAAPAV